MQNEYDIKKVMEEIELQLITSMKRTLWSHKEDEKAKGFDWPQWQALKIKQFEEYKNANKEMFNEKTKGLNRYIYKHIKDQFKEGASRTNKEAIKAAKNSINKVLEVIKGGMPTDITAIYFKESIEEINRIIKITYS